MRHRLRAIAPYVVVLVLAASLFYVAAGFVSAHPGGRLGPAVWPRAILVLLMLTCALRIARVLWIGAAPDAPSSEDRELATAAESAGVEATIDSGSTEAGVNATAEIAPPLSPLRLVVGIVVTVLYVALLPVLGFALDTGLYIVAMCRTGNYRRWRIIVPTAVIGGLGFMFVFQRIVYVSLPIGRPPFDAFALALMRVMGIH